MKYSCYIAQCRLNINEEGRFLRDSQLSDFRKELPFQKKIELTVAYDACPGYENTITVSEGLGIKVHETETEKWLFTGDDENNSCCIEANHDYSLLKGYIDLKGCADQKLAKDIFIQLLRLAVECKAASANGVSLHASCVSKDNAAILFTAPSGTGKSTQANIWEKYQGAQIMSGDRPFLSFSDPGVCVHGVPWDGKEQIFIQTNYPVKAIVEIRRAKQNRIRKLSAEQAFRLMMKQCFIPMWDDNAKFLVMKTIRELTRTVAFYRLFCLPDVNAAILVNNVLFGNDDDTCLKEVREDMKIKDGFLLRNIADEWIVMPAGSTIHDFEGAIVLNDVSAFIWKQLENPISREDLLSAVLEEYEVPRAEAVNDLDAFLSKLNEHDLLQRDDVV